MFQQLFTFYFIISVSGSFLRTCVFFPSLYSCAAVFIGWWLLRRPFNIYILKYSDRCPINNALNWIDESFLVQIICCGCASMHSPNGAALSVASAICSGEYGLAAGWCCVIFNWLYYKEIAGGRNLSDKVGCESIDLFLSADWW